MISKKVILSLLSMICIISMTAGTWASISDVKKMQKISYSRGNIVLNVFDESDWSFSEPPILPGDSKTASFTLTNNGNQKGYLFITPEINVPPGLADFFKVEIVGTNLLDKSNLFTITNAYPQPTVIPVGEMYPGDLYKITVTCSILPTSTYNEGGTYAVTMNCKLNQRDNYDNK